MADLRHYQAKRHFDLTREPKGKVRRKGGHAFVIQKHAARRLHYDLRLELDGVMKSWAVTRGPSLVPGEKRLAVQVEDHPIEYNQFEGVIPKGQYGGGTVMIWDRGTWEPENDPYEGLRKGHLSFTLEGEKLHGGWHLVRMHRRPREKRDNWLLIKQHDNAERRPKDTDILNEKPLSVTTGRSLDEIATNAPEIKKKNPSRKRKDPAHAPKTGLPAFVEPCLATLSDRAPAGDAWLHEIKFDGYRLQARIGNGKVKLLTRRNLDWTKKFPAVADALTDLPVKAALIDGEVVVENEEGVSSFSLLQQALKSGEYKHMAFYAFDLLYLDGTDLRPLPLPARKQALERLLAPFPKHGPLRFSASIMDSGPALLQRACKMGLEGIVSKRADAPYHSGRGRDWIKTKCTDRQEFVVAGVIPSTVDARAVGALVLGFHNKGKLQYAGRTGTGFSHSEARSLYRTLNALATKKSPFDPVPKEERGARTPIWVQPKMVVEVDFHGWTHGDHVRQAAFQGVREDKPAQDVVREARAVPAANTSATVKQSAPLSLPEEKSGRTNSGRRQAHETIGAVKLSHPDRIYWQEGQISKRDLAQYYTQVWPWMKPHVVGRPIALVRCPEGANMGHCFFQKHATGGVTASHLHLVSEKGDKIISIDDLDGLISLVQSGALEIHIRGTTIDHREEADRLVFDLDPGPGTAWKDVIAAAHDVRERLKGIKLKTFLKTSGGKGLHVVLPIKFTPWNEAKAFARTVAEAMEADTPERYVATASKAKRHNRIFIDYLRNSREATAIAPYSTRARPRAPVSVPIDWSELKTLKSASQYTLPNVMHRLSRLRKDPWAEISRAQQTLPNFK